MNVDGIIAMIRAKARGRTRYTGKPPYYDEVLIGEIDRLRDINAELLAALKACRDMMDHAGLAEFLEDADAAIAKAEGSDA